ncbi:MAG TPA: D-alanine--D-alanine ligase [Verrucomicrobiota bacterium]|jgi:D-alanine-D-alanine ligase|nr:D-alanine--D-alanine ligase [Verrucomicrobiota bacterium]OQC24949.1 MAG: D-alanine--D-alanine ligase B [Verrucomicrobia bacterium ADurb.Bin063]HCL92521.1 D-alanine--D-alanine ligase [Limisphaerales bacterium]HRR64818.1 D-alanine--D-alanine ligase [Candidatus Paceibacterota bacterium]MBP8015011.1 D-alanine--D-alanine ligase [Verrucomicrobiota bacterium]
MNSSLTKLNITVMLGGPSAEREVSLRSGAGVVKALRSLGHQVNELDPQNPDWKLPEGTEVVFLALHGTYGEDGTVQQRLEELGMVYTGSDPEASRIGFDKYLTKQRCVAAGIPTARYLLIESLTASWPMGWDPPVVLKPARQGSSVGLQFVERVSDWSTALAEAMRHDSRVLLEEKIAGRECTVGILADEPLPVVEVRPKSPIYDYQTKYSVGSTDYFCPAPFDAAMTARIQAAGLGAFKAIGGRDYSRVDIIVQPNGELVVLEVNTLPGMTEISVLPKAAAVAGLSYPQLCQRMVELALQRKHVVQTQT